VQKTGCIVHLSIVEIFIVLYGFEVIACFLVLNKCIREH